MRRPAFAPLLACLLTAVIVPRATAQPPEVAAVDFEFHRYFYVEFPARLASINNQMERAEAELTYYERLVDQYRPMRSFGRYGATYSADQAAQIALQAARQRVDCLRDERIALWRERQFVAERMLGATTR